MLLIESQPRLAVSRWVCCQFPPGSPSVSKRPPLRHHTPPHIIAQMMRQGSLRLSRAAVRAVASPGRHMSSVPDSEKVMCAGKIPKYFKVEEGKSYSWCSCGRSKNQPLCDGSHKGTSFTPIKYTAEKSGNVKFCMCKGSQSQPICDGSHLKVLLPWFFGGPKVKVGELYERKK